MITTVDNTISTLKNLFTEVLLNKTNKVSDITENSVLNGLAYGVAKVAQKSLKDVAIVEAQIFPETAAGEYLDRAAALFGVPARFGALGSSTYIRVYAKPGTYYAAGRNVFVSNSGIRFLIEEDFVVPEDGYGYVKVRSESLGTATNVVPNSIRNVVPKPFGHYDCTNEYYATGGRDAEDDDMFRRRILNHQNVYSAETLEKLVQVFQEADNRVLRIMFVGLEEDSYIHIKIATQNGQDLSQAELDALLLAAEPYFGIGDMKVNGSVTGIKLENADWYVVGGDDGIDFRCSIDGSYDTDAVRKSIQVGLTKYFDPKYWNSNKKIEWDDLLEIVKNTEGVKYVSSQYFLPREDEFVPEYMLPRIKKFIMRDLDGNVIFDNSVSFVPSFYPSN